MKKFLLIVAVVAAVGIVACNKHKNAQCCKQQSDTTEVKEKVEDAAKAVGTAVKNGAENAVDTVKTKAEALKQSAEEKAEAAKEKIDQEKKKAGTAIVNAAEKVQEKLD